MLDPCNETMNPGGLGSYGLTSPSPEIRQRLASRSAWKGSIGNGRPAA